MLKEKRLAKAKLLRLYTFEDARRIKGPFVYGLSDGDGIFYVGKTVDANRRFYSYTKPSKCSPRLQRRIRDALGPVMVSILEHNPRDLDAAERKYIAMYAPNLVNQSGSIRYMSASMRLTDKNSALRTQLSRCSGCGSTKAHTKDDPCKHSRVEIINPLANELAQEMLITAGLIRERFSLPMALPETAAD
jgi:hypothetical protein